jgi:ABC-2 type transport system permease protein
MSVPHTVRAAPTLLRIGFAEIVAYRAEMAIWVLTATMPLIMLALWNAVARDGPVAGFGQVEFARYFAAALVVRQLTGAWILWELNYHIRTGSLSPLLLRPMHPLVYSGMSMVTAMPFRMVILAPLLGALVLWRPELWQVPDLQTFAVFLVSVVLAWVMAFLIQAIFGMLAFWLDQSMGLFGVWFATWGLLSGYVAPMDVLPDAIRPVVDWMPFRGMLAVPVELLGGFLTAGDALGDIAVQVGWVVLLSALAAFLWKRGVRRYGAYGA